jgi:hypothetical protein
MILKRAVAVSTPTASRVRFDLNSKDEKRIVTSAKYKTEVMTSDTIRMNMASVQPLDFKLRDYVEYDGQYYFLNLLPSIKREGSWRYAYDMEFEGAMYELGRVVFKIDDAHGFDYLGTMYEICNFITMSMEKANTWLKVCGYPQQGGGYAWTNYFVFDKMTSNGVQWKSIEGGYYMNTSVKTIDDASEWATKKANYKGQVTICPDVSDTTSVNIWKNNGGSVTVYGQQYILEVGGTWSLDFERDALTADSEVVKTKEELCSFDQHTCLAVLQELMNTYEKWQWEVRYNGDTVSNNKPFDVGGKTCVGGVLYLRQSNTGFSRYVQGGSYPVDDDFPVTDDWELSYGKGNGLKSIKRSYINEGYLPTKIYCYGSNQNVPSNYRSTRICLPNKEQNESYKRITNNLEWLDVNEQNDMTEVVKVFDEAMPANKPFEVAAMGGTQVDTINRETSTTSVTVTNVTQPKDCNTKASSDLLEEQPAVFFHYGAKYSVNLFRYRQYPNASSPRNAEGIEFGKIKTLSFHVYRTNHNLFYHEDSGGEIVCNPTRHFYLYLSQGDNPVQYKAAVIVNLGDLAKKQMHYIKFDLEAEGNTFDYNSGCLNVCVVDDTGAKCYAGQTFSYAPVKSMRLDYGVTHPVHFYVGSNNTFISGGADSFTLNPAQSFVGWNNNGMLPTIRLQYAPVQSSETHTVETTTYSKTYTMLPSGQDIVEYINTNNLPAFDFWVRDRDYNGFLHPLEPHNFFDLFSRWYDSTQGVEYDKNMDFEFGTYNEWCTLHYNSGQNAAANYQRFLDGWLDRFAYYLGTDNLPVITFLTGDCAGMSFNVIPVFEISENVYLNKVYLTFLDENDPDASVCPFEQPAKLTRKYFRVRCYKTKTSSEIDPTLDFYSPSVESGIYPKAGDKFIVESVSMPAMYTYYQGAGDEFSAEAQLDAASDKYIEELTDKYKYEVEIATDFLIENSPVFRKHDKIRLTDNALINSHEESGGSIVERHYKDVTVTAVEYDLIKPDCKIEVSNYKGRKNITIAIANAMSNNVNYR